MLQMVSQQRNAALDMLAQANVHIAAMAERIQALEAIASQLAPGPAEVATE